MTDPTDDATPDRLIEILTRRHDTGITGPHGEYLIRDDPALITALRAAQTSSVGRGGGGGAAASERTALDLKAFAVYHDLERTIRRWALNTGWTRTGPTWPYPETLLRAWYAHTSPDGLRRNTPRLRAWIRQITDLVIDPPIRWSLDLPCPECGTRRAIIGPPGHREQVDALHVTARDDGDHEIVCRHCGHTWTGLAGAQQLNAALDQKGHTA